MTDDPSAQITENGGGAVLDALPYIDDAHYTESHRQHALQLIQTEFRTLSAKRVRKKNYLAHLPEPNMDAFLTPMIRAEHVRIGEKKEFEKLDLVRYDVPSPANTSKSGDKRAWQGAINNCKSQLGSQHLRQMNLEILEEYGPEAYRSFNQELQQVADKEEAGISELRSQLYEINSRRKRTQLAAGEKLTELGRNWVELVTKNARMEVEIMKMEKEVAETAKRLKVDAEKIN